MQKFHLPYMQESVHNKIVCIRGHHIIADADVAALYGVETKRINEAVRNNLGKFPQDYMFTLTAEEIAYLRSKNSTTKVSTKSRSFVKAFTEKGLYMLATILKSKRAQDVTFAIIETFAKVRYLKSEIQNLHEENKAQDQAIKIQEFGKSFQI